MKLFRKLVVPVLVIMAGFSVMSGAQVQQARKGEQEDKDSLVVLLSPDGRHRGSKLQKDSRTGTISS